MTATQACGRGELAGCAILAVLLFTPVFFQLTGNLYTTPSTLLETSGVTRLPIPLAVPACLAGLLWLGRGWRSCIGVSCILLTLAIMLASSAAASGGQVSIDQVRRIACYYFLPMTALVLGQLYARKEITAEVFPRACLGVLCVLLPAHLAASWAVHHSALLTDTIFVFAVYHHLQYVPVLLVAGYVIGLYELWDSPSWRPVALALAPLVAVYAAASLSMTAMATLAGGWLLLAFRLRRTSRSPVWFGVASTVLVVGYLVLAKTVFHSPTFEQKLTLGIGDGWLRFLPPNLAVRFAYWSYFAEGVVNDASSFWFGHVTLPDVSEIPSAHNYYLDVAYGFGVPALVPLLMILGQTGRQTWEHRRAIYESPGLLALAFVVAMLLVVDSSLKVGLRIPYPGILSFFLWGMLLGRLSLAPRSRPRNATLA